MKIEFYFDCASPWSYLCFERIIPLAAKYGLPIEWRPVLVGGIFNAVSPGIEFNNSSRGVAPAKLAYHSKNMQDWARLTGLEIHFPPAGHPINSVKAMRSCLVLKRSDQLVPFARACYQAYFVRQLPLSDDEVLLEICDKAGVDGQWLFARIAEQDVKDALRAEVDEAIARGAFGVPTTFLENTDMYFGVDSLQLVAARLEEWKSGYSAASGA